MRKPKSIKKGDKVAIVSLSSGILGESFSKHEIALGIERMQSMGMKPVFMPNALKGVIYLKEHPEARAQDLKDAFFDDDVKAIFCVIGGDDTYRLLPYLMEDVHFCRKVQESPKLFSGFSDTTINHFMFYKLGITSYYGPNFLCDFAELAPEMLLYTKDSLLRYFYQGDKREILSSQVWYEERLDFSEESVGIDRIAHKEKRGYEVIQGKGKVKGQLLGGCLESMYDMITGERYADEKAIIESYQLFPSREEWKGKLLFFETSEEKPSPALFEQELLAIMEKGVFDVVAGIIVGKPQGENYYEEYKDVLKKVLQGKDVPVLYNVNFGHAEPRGIIPYGILAEIDLERKEFKLLDSMMDYS